MTDGPMDAMEHPDEGLIHAWLDDALGAAEAERLAAHVRTCVECQARVAEARGLIAGASRIVAALDDAPAGSRPGWAQGAIADGGMAADVAPAGAALDPRTGSSLWRWLRVTPGRAALAATILVAIGITLTYDRGAIDSTSRSAAVGALNPQSSDVPAATSPEGAASDAAKPRDELLDSAVARNLAMTQGRRTVGATPGPTVPQAPPPSTTLQAPASAAGEAVALGRAKAKSEQYSIVVPADRAPARRDITGAVASIEPSATAGMGKVQPPSAPVAGQSQRAMDGAMMEKTSANAVAKTCLMLESSDADARWADQAFPLVLAIEPGPADAPRDAAVLTPAGETTPLRAQWSPRGGDSVSVRLRRIGYSGSIVLGPETAARSGVAVSAAAPTMLEEVASSSAPAQARADTRRAAAPAAARPTPAPGPPVRQLRVTARSVGCPAR